ncbi:manganese efflux pump MntP family protein [Mangrovibacterium marinum]|uniref:Putative manganese efflux pump MntP n=1 Tax=Mangrovibacterium marinum TaxID=1639118 RepID=A0A2T5C052_9BACT|nr:manganese efflux pump MntP family protein [Mangrovibacterium marinum]PTN07936.1 putative Mn2+ efflux pump MntP [Mangrovibacterium marinum]
MYYYTIIVLAMGLSVDSFAVSVSSGLSLPKIRFFQAAKLAFLLAVFQAAMPVLGWLLENSIRRFIEPVDHWIAFGLLSLIGGKMILETRKTKEERTGLDPMIFKVALVLAFATSIDAMAVGFGMAMMMERITPAVLIIGSITFIASMLGVLIGKKSGSQVSKHAEIVGGVILILIGCRILLEHLHLWP